MSTLSNTTRATRRGFLQGAGASVAALAIGFDASGALAKAGGGVSQINPFVTIGADGTVTAIIKHFEGGQGTATGLSALVAEELNMRLQDIRFQEAPSNPKVYNNLFFGPFQGTGGSTAIANSYVQYRTAAAAAREMLIAAAAKTWGVEANALSLKDGVISGGGKKGGVGEFAAAAAALTPPAAPKLKDPADFTVIGVDQKARLDTARQDRRLGPIRDGRAARRADGCRHQALPALWRSGRLLR